MKMKKWIRVLESCAFLLLLGAVLFSVSRLVERKKGRNLFGPFLQEAEMYDVLFIGDSRFMNGMIPIELWADYGIAGYNLSCYGNSLPVTYWTMMNALDYGTPKLMVLSVNGVGDEGKITGSSGDLHTALDFFPLSRTKANAIEDLMHDPENPDARDDEGNRYQDVRWEYYFPLGKYHSRWSELGREDFMPRPGLGNGGEVLVGVQPFGEYELIDEERYAEEMGYGYSYLRRAIEACRSRGIEVLLVSMPEPAMQSSQMHAHTAGSVAEEYGVSYIDLTSLDSVVDYEVDSYDSQPHLNASGTQKMTDYLGSYLDAHYDLPDRRQDPRYAHWKGQYDAHVDEKIKRLGMEKNLLNVLMLLHDRDFDLHIALQPDTPVYYDDLAILLMHNIAREHVLAGEEYSMWSNAMYPLAAFDEALWENEPYYLHVENGNAHEYRADTAWERMQKRFRENQKAPVMIEVIDRRTGESALQMQF